MKKHVIVIGAGPGGLTSAMILAKRGFDVTIYEKDGKVGGRNQEIRLGDYTFDTGPTFLMLKNVLDEVFMEAGADGEKLLNFQKIEPMYRLVYDEKDHINPSNDHDFMKEEIARLFPGKEAAMDDYLKDEKTRFEKMFACLQKPYGKISDFFSPQFIKAIPHFALGKSLMDVLTGYFDEEKLALAFTFQAKYLGMSPWECPGAFALISYIEHAYGIYHVEGGLCKISEAMADVAVKNGAKLHLSTPVKKVITENGKAIGVELENGEKVTSDEVIINADFGYAATNLFEEGLLKKYTPEKVKSMKYSCSIFMLYLGIDKEYDMPHHTIYFADDYKTNVADIFENKNLSDDMSFYVRNTVGVDKTNAPEGHSALYILVPVANLEADVDWDKEKERYKELLIDTMIKKTCMKDLREHIKAEKVITPTDWRDNYNVYNGATFNLAHNFGQMLYFRPHNKFEDVDNVYLAGGGTHPGSGLPTIYESGRISANMICKKYKVSYESKNTLV
jgi:phytoene desaturase